MQLWGNLMNRPLKRFAVNLDFLWKHAPSLSQGQLIKWNLELYITFIMQFENMIYIEKNYNVKELFSLHQITSLL